MAEFPAINSLSDINETTLAQLEKALQQGFAKEKLYWFGEEPANNVYIVGEPAMEQFRVWAERQGNCPGSRKGYSVNELPLTIVELGVKGGGFKMVSGTTTILTPSLHDRLEYLQYWSIDPRFQIGMTLNRQSFFMTGAALLAIWKEKCYFPYYLSSQDGYEKFLGKCGCTPQEDSRTFFKGCNNTLTVLSRLGIRVDWLVTNDIPKWFSGSIPGGIKYKGDGGAASKATWLITLEALKRDNLLLSDLCNKGKEGKKISKLYHGQSLYPDRVQLNIELYEDNIDLSWLIPLVKSPDVVGWWVKKLNP